MAMDPCSSALPSSQQKLPLIAEQNAPQKNAVDHAIVKQKMYVPLLSLDLSQEAWDVPPKSPIHILFTSGTSSSTMKPEKGKLSLLHTPTPVPTQCPPTPPGSHARYLTRDRIPGAVPHSLQSPPLTPPGYYVQYLPSACTPSSPIQHEQCAPCLTPINRPIPNNMPPSSPTGSHARFFS